MTNKITHTTLVEKIIKLEADLGGEIFRDSKSSDTHKFFCLDEKTWIWQRSNNQKTTLVKYVVKNNGVVKSINGGGYRGVTKTEARNLFNASKIYKQIIEEKVYQPLLRKY